MDDGATDLIYPYPSAKGWRIGRLRLCPWCSALYPVDRLNRKFCSRACKYASFSSKPRKPRRKLTKAARQAHSLVATAILNGSLTRPNRCSKCKALSRKIEAAHRSYMKPLDVVWLCVSCHRRWDHASPKGGTHPR